MNEYLRYLLQAAASIVFFILSYMCVQHGSKAALDMGFAFGLAGLFHWVLWPPIE